MIYNNRTFYAVRFSLIPEGPNKRTMTICCGPLIWAHGLSGGLPGPGPKVPGPAGAGPEPGSPL